MCATIVALISATIAPTMALSLVEIVVVATIAALTGIATAATLTGAG